MIKHYLVCYNQDGISARNLVIKHQLDVQTCHVCQHEKARGQLSYAAIRKKIVRGK